MDRKIEKCIIQHRAAYRLWNQQFVSLRTKHVERIPSRHFLKMHAVTQGNMSTILYAILLLTWTRTILTSLAEERFNNWYCISLWNMMQGIFVCDHSALAFQCDIQKYLCYRMKSFAYSKLLYQNPSITTIQYNNVCKCHFLKNSLEV